MQWQAIKAISYYTCMGWGGHMTHNGGMEPHNTNGKWKRD